MTESGLKPCPFCGGPADFRGDFDSFQIECTTECGTTGAKYITENGATAAWNRRALSDHAEAEQLRAALQQIVEEAPSSNPLHRIAAKALADTPPAHRATEQAWIPVGERLPEYSVVVLATDGEYLAAASRSFEIEGDMRLRGYEADGEIGPRFTDQIPNPDAGKRHEYFFPIGCSAFNVNTNVENYDGPLHFTPSHWMPLPPSPKEKE